MFRQFSKKLTFGITIFNYPTLIAPIVKTAWHLPVRKNTFLPQSQQYRRFFSTVSVQSDFKSNFATFLKEKIEKDPHEIKDEAIKTEVKSLYNILMNGMQKNLEEQPNFVKIIQKNMSEVVKGHDIISIPIGKFSNQAMSAFFEQLDNHGYAASVSWLSEELCGGWIVNNTEIVLSFCKKIPGITDRDILSPIPLSTEEHGRVFKHVP